MLSIRGLYEVAIPVRQRRPKGCDGTRSLGGPPLRPDRGRRYAKRR